MAANGVLDLGLQESFDLSTIQNGSAIWLSFGERPLMCCLPVLLAHSSMYLVFSASDLDLRGPVRMSLHFSPQSSNWI